jgi:hypothetical protein
VALVAGVALVVVMALMAVGAVVTRARSPGNRDGLNSGGEHGTVGIVVRAQEQVQSLTRYVAEPILMHQHAVLEAWDLGKVMG